MLERGHGLNGWSVANAKSSRPLGMYSGLNLYTIIYLSWSSVIFYAKDANVMLHHLAETFSQPCEEHVSEKRFSACVQFCSDMFWPKIWALVVLWLDHRMFAVCRFVYTFGVVWKPQATASKTKSSKTEIPASGGVLTPDFSFIYSHTNDIKWHLMNMHTVARQTWMWNALEFLQEYVGTCLSGLVVKTEKAKDKTIQEPSSGAIWFPACFQRLYKSMVLDVVRLVILYTEMAC